MDNVKLLTENIFVILFLRVLYKYYQFMSGGRGGCREDLFDRTFLGCEEGD